jgi:hypothetical protein
LKIIIQKKSKKFRSSKLPILFGDLLVVNVGISFEKFLLLQFDLGKDFEELEASHRRGAVNPPVELLHTKNAFATV